MVNAGAIACPQEGDFGKTNGEIGATGGPEWGGVPTSIGRRQGPVDAGDLGPNDDSSDDQNAFDNPACFNTALAVWRDFTDRSSVKGRSE